MEDDGWLAAVGHKQGVASAAVEVHDPDRDLSSDSHSHSGGLGLAAAVGNLLSMILYEVNPRDPVVFAAIIAFLSKRTLRSSTVPNVLPRRNEPW